MKDIINRLGLPPNQDAVTLLQILKSRKIDTMQKLYAATNDTAKTQELYSLLEDIEKLILALDKETPLPQGNVKHKIASFKKDHADNVRSGGYSKGVAESNFFEHELQAGEGLSNNIFEENRRKDRSILEEESRDKRGFLEDRSGDGSNFNIGVRPTERDSKAINMAVTRSMELFNEQLYSSGTNSTKTKAAKIGSETSNFVKNLQYDLDNSEKINSESINKVPINSEPINKETINKETINKEAINKEPINTKPINTTPKNISLSDTDTDTDKVRVMENDQKNAVRGLGFSGPRHTHRPEKELSDLEVVELQKNLINIDELIQLEEIMREEEKAVKPAAKGKEVSQETSGMMGKLSDLFSNDLLSQVAEFAHEPQNREDADETPNINASRGSVTDTTTRDTTKRAAKIYKLNDKRESINNLPEYSDGERDKSDKKKYMESRQSDNKSRREQGKIEQDKTEQDTKKQDTRKQDSTKKDSTSVFDLYSENANKVNQGDELPGLSLNQAQPEGIVQSLEEIRLEDLAADMLEAEQRAKAKEIEALMEFGDMFWQCQNYSRALEYYRKAAAQGHIQSLKRLGDAYYYGLGTEQDYKTALIWFGRAAEEGSTEAQSHIGECYYYGCGVTQDYKKASAWYRKAALQGDAFAQKRLADCCYSGDGTAQDYAEALQWYLKATEQGFILAHKGLGDCYFYGRGIERDYAKAVICYTQAALKGNTDAQINLSGCYYYGDGVEQNYSMAVSWLQKAAAQGSAIAQINLGNCYSQGLGISQDYEEAVIWYKKAAEQGDALAQTNLGNCYYFGEGVPQDYVEAVKWLQKAADHENSAAQYNLGSCYYYGHGVPQDRQKALKWYKKAADLGNAMAKEMLKNQGFIGRN